MKLVAKFFNTAGLIKQDIHYCVNPLSRFDLEESAIADRLSIVLQDNMPKDLFQEMKQKENADSLLTAYLREICIRIPKPLVLFIDETDALVGDSVLR